MNYKAPLTQLALALCCLLQQTEASATSMEKKNFRQMVQEAELIFDGVVTKVAYKNSAPSVAAPNGIPHTFVTFHIDQPFKGSSAQGNEITLRFEGGPAGRHQMMLVPNVPLFDVGERNVLFVKNNGAAPCPLAGWDQGRMREVNGELLSENGQQLFLDKKQNVVMGAYKNATEVWNHQMGDQVLGFDVPTAVKKAALSTPKGAKKLDVAGIGKTIADTLVQVRAQEQKTHLMAADAKPANSVDVNQAFQMNGVIATAPPSGAAPAKRSAATADTWESELLNQNGGDPTLSSQEVKAPQKR